MMPLMIQQIQAFSACANDVDMPAFGCVLLVIVVFVSCVVMLYKGFKTN